MKPLRDLLQRDDLGIFRANVEDVVARVSGMHSEQTIDMACDWRIAIENTLESAHVPFVHPTSIARLGLKCTEMIRGCKNSFQRFAITDLRTLRGLRAIAPNFENAESWNEYFHLYLYPRTCLSSVGGFTYSLQQYFPTESGTVLLTRLYIPHVRAASPDLAFYFDAAAKFNKQVFAEDANMCRRIHIRSVRMPCPQQLTRLAWFTEALDADSIAA